MLLHRCILLGCLVILGQCSSETHLKKPEASSGEHFCRDSSDRDCQSTAAGGTPLSGSRFSNIPSGESDNSDTHRDEKPSDKYKKTVPGDTSEEAKDSDEYRDLLRRVMHSVEGMLDSVGESRVKVMEKLERIIDQMSVSKDKMVERLEALLGSVSESRLMVELDHLLDELAHSKVIEEIKSLPRELKESVVLGVRNRSYVAAGIMVAITTAILISGSLYYAWCHTDEPVPYDQHMYDVDNTSAAQSSNGTGQGSSNGSTNPEQKGPSIRQNGHGGVAAESSYNCEKRESVLCSNGELGAESSDNVVRKRETGAAPDLGGGEVKGDSHKNVLRNFADVQTEKVGGDKEVGGDAAAAACSEDSLVEGAQVSYNSDVQQQTLGAEEGEVGKKDVVSVLEGQQVESNDCSEQIPSHDKSIPASDVEQDGKDSPSDSEADSIKTEQK